MFRRAVLVLSALGIVVLSTAPASARYYHRGRGGATPYSSAAGGLAAVIRAEGAYNQMTAQAALSVEKAKAAALDNKLKAAQTYYQLHRLNEAEKAEAERKRLALYRHADPPKPPRPTASQLDPVTGAVTWPTILLDAHYASERQLVETLFALRASDPSHVTATQIEHAAEALREKLDARIGEYATADFFTARHLIEGLAAEPHYGDHGAAQTNGAGR